MLLAADIGGTHARIGLFTDAPAPEPIAIRSYPTAAIASFAELWTRFTSDHGAPFDVRAAGVGIAGPVQQGRGALTNGTWGVSAAEVATASGARHAVVVNDLVAFGWCVTGLDVAHRVTLQAGDASLEAAGAGVVAAVMAPGTGLGEATVVRIDGRFHVLASESGHADFAARTDREWELAARLRHAHGRASVEDVLSGRGLSAVARLTHAGRACAASTPEAVTGNGLAATCDACVEALHVFAGALGAEAGNLALRTLPSGGVYIGGGIAGALLPVLTRGPFLDAFNRKDPMAGLLARTAVHVVTDTDAGLRGAAIAARQA
ncbi:MAG: glucokinase [Vicinamibacterales bacterium]